MPADLEIVEVDLIETLFGCDFPGFRVQSDVVDQATPKVIIQKANLFKAENLRGLKEVQIMVRSRETDGELQRLLVHHLHALYYLALLLRAIRSGELLHALHILVF